MNMEKKYVSYLRCSTKDQLLGIEAQRNIVNNFVIGKGLIINEYVEWESGKNDNRIELDKAINQCKKDGTTLIIAKIDRLSRNVSFLFKVKDCGIDICVPDLPDMNALTFGIFAVFAQHEREMISKRTKEALQVLKDKGVKLGNPRLGEYNKNAVKASKIVLAKNKEENVNNKNAARYIADERSKGTAWLIILEQLNYFGFKSSRGLDFKYVSQLQRLYKAS